MFFSFLSDVRNDFVPSKSHANDVAGPILGMKAPKTKKLDNKV